MDDDGGRFALDPLSVGEVARLSGVTVRTLHHYDEVGLLSPRGRSPAGYRLYHADDLARLRRILGYRDLGFGLEEIGVLLDEGADPIEHLRTQHRLLTERLARVRRTLDNLEKMMDAHDNGVRLTPAEMLEVFGDDDPTRYADEAQERWGQTDAYAQSQRRTSPYTAADWLQIKAEAAAVNQALASAMADGEPADGQRAMDAAQAHRDHISRWFYDVSAQLHTGLADMYLTDPRFTQNYEDVAPGLARYVHDAIHANAARPGP
jgi:MerR family transcriptional regulator, thiopeptide resistance regulator